MKTYSPKPDHIERHWYVLDASGQILGRLASHAATLLRGKHKPVFAPHMDTGDHVIVVNADKIELTGGKAQTKVAYRHSGYPGGIRGTSYERILAERPVFAVEKAVRGMLPKNRLGRAMIRKLHVVAGPEHRHAAQKPIELAVGERPAWEGLPVVPAAAAPVGVKEKAVTPAATPATKPAARKAPAKPTARKTTARKTTARKTTSTRKSTARKPTARKAATTSVKKPTATKTAAKKPTATKTAAKKPTTRARTTKDKE